MRKIGSALILFLLIIVGVFFGINETHSLNAHPNAGSVLPAQTSRDASPTQAVVTSLPDPATPQTLQIPKIGVNATVESVGNDSQGRMDIPKNSDDVAWYSPGYKPGQNGNAVIDGHLDKVYGAPAVFWNISKLGAGDKIIVTDNKGNSHTFSVIRTAKFPYDNFPIKDVFGPSSKPMLNLITCQGTWDATKHLYSHRFVVFAEEK